MEENEKKDVVTTDTAYGLGIQVSGTTPSVSGTSGQVIYDMLQRKVEKPPEGTDENPEEEKELTDEEKHAIFIQALKESKIKFHPIKHGKKKTVGMIETVNKIGTKKKVRKQEFLTNVTVNQFGADYRKKRQQKNRMQKKSRKLARKK